MYVVRRISRGDRGRYETGLNFQVVCTPFRPLAEPPFDAAELEFIAAFQAEDLAEQVCDLLNDAVAEAPTRLTLASPDLGRALAASA